MAHEKTAEMRPATAPARMGPQLHCFVAFRSAAQQQVFRTPRRFLAHVTQTLLTLHYVVLRYSNIED